MIENIDLSGIKKYKIKNIHNEHLIIEYLEFY